MGLETVNVIADLVATNPLSSDLESQGDDHIRNLKSALRQCFAGFTGAIFVTGTDGGAVNAYTLTPATPLIAYGTKMEFVFAPVVTNTGACTINISGLGVKDLKSASGAALVPGDLVAGSIYAAFYNGTEARLLAITKNYVDQVAMTAALPAIPAGTVFRGLFAYGGVAAFRTEPFVRIPRTSNTALDETVGACLIDITSGTFTQTIAAVAGLPIHWFCWIQNSGTGTITLDPNGSETVDGLTTRMIYPGEIIKLYKDETAAAFRVIVEKAFYMKTNGTGADYNFAMPSGYAGNLVDVDGVGGAGGAGSGRKGAAGSLRQGGSPGGAPGRIRRTLQITPGTSIAVAHGAAGIAGAAQTVDSTNGNAGTAGGNSTFGTLATAYGGCAGVGGGDGSFEFGICSGSGSLSAGSSAYAALNGKANGGGPRGVIATLSYTSLMEEGGADAFAQNGGPGYNSIYGGASSVTDNTLNTTTGVAGNSQFGVAAGGFGGWVIAGNTPAAGGTAGKTGTWTGTGAAGGTSGATPTAGANGMAGATDLDMGNPGGGGGSTATAGVNGGRGGDGAAPGAPGGGGGACTNGVGNSGAGGTSQPGQWIVTGRLK